MTVRKFGLVLLTALAVIAFSAETLKRSNQRLRPRYDDVSYLALARDFAREGGIAATVRCYLEARCKEDNRPPLFQFLLEPVVDDEPRSFANAKIVTHGTALLLLATVFAFTRRAFSPAVAIGSVIALASMPALPEMASHLLHDLLFATLTFGFVYAMSMCQERGTATWLAIGALAGLAFLTKASGHVLFVPLAATAIYRHRGMTWRRPILYAAAAAFVAVSFFLLWRNHRLWGSPFYNVNAREVWLDSWQDYFTERLSPHWDQFGLGWYLRHKSALALVVKLARGFGLCVGTFVYAAGIGPALVPVRAATGLVVLALAACGTWRRYHQGARVEVFAVISSVAVYFAALSLAASGGPGPQVRYAFPYVLLILPFAVEEALLHGWPRIESWYARRSSVAPATVGLGLLAAALVGRLAWAAPGAAGDPRRAYAVDPHDREASEWLARSLAPGEPIALDYRSEYSTWDLPHPDPDPRFSFWMGTPAAQLSVFFDQKRIRKVVVDSTIADYAPKLSREADPHGALAFLGWPRCFADSGTPSRILIYCRPSKGLGQ